MFKNHPSPICVTASSTSESWAALTLKVCRRFNVGRIFTNWNKISRIIHSTFICSKFVLSNFLLVMIHNLRKWLGEGRTNVDQQREGVEPSVYLNNVFENLRNFPLFENFESFSAIFRRRFFKINVAFRLVLIRSFFLLKIHYCEKISLWWPWGWPIVYVIFLVLRRRSGQIWRTFTWERGICFLLCKRKSVENTNLCFSVDAGSIPNTARVISAFLVRGC